MVLVLLHGISSVKILAILYLNFRIPDLVGAESPFTPALTWTFNIAMLFSNELCQGYHFASLWSGLAFLVSLTTDHSPDRLRWACAGCSEIGRLEE